MAAPENSRISPAKLALAVRRLRAEKENLDLIASDPIAIIGMGCRFPGGAATPEEFWTALKDGRDCIGEISAERWKDSASLEANMRRGGYLSEIDGFDAAYFGISPREAQQMDPQQRLLLEVTWEALWDAGIHPDSLTGTDTGVFAAIYNSDYARLHFRDTSALTSHAGIGTAHSVAAGRLSFLLNINGPSLALDSACSSSLVATHLACQSLRAHECSLAIAGASSLKLLSDEVQVFSKWGMLASDGKCKTFDASADGFAPGEGGGVLILKRLSDALQDGDRVRAVIRGTAVNHDGRTTVLTAPSGLAQEAVLRAALRNAMLEPREVSYIETHGTGTSLGDPIEIEAVSSVYGRAGTDSRPCVLGAVKTNLGHLEAAAGIAGLIKTVLCLEHGEIPKNLHFNTLNPEIQLAGSRLKIATENMPWSRGSQPRVAGVSSFGLGGTNGHIIVEEAPLLPAKSSTEGGRAIPLAAYPWQRQRFWLAEPVKSKESSARDLAATASTIHSVHPLLGRRIDSPFVKGMLFESDINTAATPYLAEHRLGKQAIVPFAAFLEIATAAIRETDKSGHSVIRNFVMHEPRFVSAASSKLQVLVGNRSVEIASESRDGWTTNAKGSFESAATETRHIDLESLRARCNQSISPEDIYQNLERTGLRYGRAFRVIQSVCSGRDEVLAHLRLPEELIQEANQYGLHPTLLDGCLQTVMAARGEITDDLFLPISMDIFELRQPGAIEVWVHTKIVDSSAETFSADLVVANNSGDILARLTGFTAKRTNAQLIESLANKQGLDDSALLYELAWRVRPLASGASSTIPIMRTGERWLLIESKEGNCVVLAKLLTQQGAVCEIVRDEKFRGSMLAEASWTGVLYDARGIGKSPQGMMWQHPEKSSVGFILEFVKSLATSKTPVPRLWIVSSSAAEVLPLEDVAVAHAPLWGLARTLSLEYPEVSPVLIDAGPDDLTSMSIESDVEAMLAAEIGVSNSEASDVRQSIVAFRNGTRYAAHVAHPPQHVETVQRLQIDTSGRLEDLRIVSAARKDPEPHEVEIEVRASGLNFRDVLTALGMFTARNATPGAECSGTIVRIGSNVREWKVGDNVLAFAPASFQSFVNVPADFVMRKPAAMTFADAAGIPVAFLTALYGLDRLAKISKGQSILIHAAAGGLGLAAVQLAMQAGAEVFATAGSAEKREFLKQLGVKHIFDSRSLLFREQVLQSTGGAGVDVVLNSLAGDFVRATFEVVAKGGCFLEVGKRDIWNAKDVAALGKDIRYFAFDLGDVAMKQPSLIAEMMHELMESFSTGKLRPLPTALHAFEDATQAFRTMAQARHIGKIVLGLSDRGTHKSVRDLISEGTVLITGGLGALGLETAQWLATQGARNFVLAGRNAQDNNEHPIIAELRKQGIDVAIKRTDVAVSEQLELLLDKIRATKPPLRAIVHAAGIVQDSVLGKESWNSYRAATASKIEGAWNLHRLTQNDPVQLMVLYSSAASILGSPGQGSYAAGNAFLDALAHHRASRGLQTLSVNWGAWGSAGMAARRSTEQIARWTRLGSRTMEPVDALATLRTAIESGRTQVAIMDMDWEQFLGGRSDPREAALFKELQPREEREDRSRKNAVDDAEEEFNILASIRSALTADQKMILSAHVKVCARRVLGLDPSAAIQDNVPLQDVGLDSLMALEMRNELAQSLKLTLAAGLLFDYPSVEQLTRHLLELLAKAVSTDTNAAMPSVADGSVAALDSLSDEEAERLLIQELDRAERENANA